MQPVWICNWALILLLASFNLIGQEMQPLISYTPFPSMKPPILTINGEDAYNYTLDLEHDHIIVQPHTFFCIAEMAHAVKSPQQNVLFAYFVHNYAHAGIELVGDEARFISPAVIGWHYYIFKTKDKKGIFPINLISVVKDLSNKCIQVKVADTLRRT